MQVSTHIHAIHLPFFIPLPSGQRLPRQVYAYLVMGEKIALIDSGVAGSEKIVFDYLGRIGKSPLDIELLIFTHAHPDHIGAAKAIREQSGCATSAHFDAKDWIEDVELQFAVRPVPGFHSLVGGSTQVDHLLSDNEVLDLGGVTLKILHTPGHSKDSLSLFCLEDGVLISGDAVPHPGDLPIYEDPEASVSSIDRMRRLENLKVLLSSWSAPEPGADPLGLLDEGIRHLQHLHELVRSIAAQERTMPPMDLCRALVQRLGLPEAAINPLVARSFASHLPLLDQKSL